MDAFSAQQDTLPLGNHTRKETSYLYKNIGPYRVDSLWKKGPLSHLYLATDLEKHRSVVLKILSPDLLNLPEMVDQFLKESEIISKIDHPNIVSVFETGQWEHGFYIAMQYLQGISLKQFLTHHKVTEKSALNITLKVAYALLHLHTHSIIHRDIKPENILILDNGEIKLIDFGIAKLEGQSAIGLEKRAASIIGTPNYMSPEQKKNPLRVSYQSDIYSLGMVLQELLLGKMCHGKKESHHLSDELKAIVDKATATHTEHRFEDVVDFISAITLHLKKLPTKLATSDHFTPKPQATQKLEKPNWPLIDISIVGGQLDEHSPSFCHFFSFEDGTYALLYCQQEELLNALEALPLMQGYLIAHLSHHKQQGITPAAFLEIFNKALDDLKLPKLRFTYVLLNPRMCRLHFLSSHFAPFFMLRADSSELMSLAGAPQGTTDATGTTHHWQEGDALFIHSHMASPKTLTPPPCPALSLESSATKLHTYLASKQKADPLVIALHHLG